MKNVLSQRLQDAMALAVQVHGNMKRKGDGLPYIIHPITVLTLLTRWGADEDTCIAGLLHDVLEDVSEERKDDYRNTIAEKFGDTVLEIVEGVTEQDKSLPWKERKERYLEHLRKATEGSLVVSCADLTHNLFSLVAAYKEQGEEVWKHFNTTKQWKVWFIDQRTSILKERLPGRYVNELCGHLDDLNTLLSQPLPPEYVEAVGKDGRRLMFLIRTAGKTEEQITTEVMAAYLKYQAEKEKAMQGSYKVFVDDNFHYMDSNYRTVAGTFDSLEEAIRTCKHITIRSVMDQFEPGISAARMKEKYIAFGKDPYIISTAQNRIDDALPFSAWSFVTEDLCAMIIGEMQNSPLAEWRSRNTLLTPEDGSPEECIEQLLQRWSTRN